MIPFNPVFTKLLLSAVLSLITVYCPLICIMHSLSVKTASLRGKLHFCLFFCPFPLKYFIKIRMCNRCPLLIFPCNLNACIVNPGGGHHASWLSVLMGHSSAAELQMRRKGGQAVDHCSFHMHYLCLWWLLPHIQTLWVLHQQTAQNAMELQEITGSHTRVKAYSAAIISLSLLKPPGFLIGHIWLEAA